MIPDSGLLFWANLYIQGGPKKYATVVNHHEIVLKPAIMARIFISFD